MHNKQNSKKSTLRKSRLLLIGLSIFGVSLGTSITATYAFYTVNSVDSINDLNIIIDTGDINLALGVKDGDNIVYERTDENADIWKIDTETKLKDVSAMWKSEWMGKKDTPELRTSYRGSGNVEKFGVATNPKEDGFIQKEYYLKSTHDLDVYLDKDSKIVANHEINQEKARATSGPFAAPEAIVSNADLLDNVQYASRVSFYCDEDNYTIVANKKDGADTYYGGRLDLNGDGCYDYKEDSNHELREIIYGEFSGEWTDNNLFDTPLEERQEKKTKSCFDSGHAANTYTVKQADLESNGLVAKEKAFTFDEVIYDETDPYRWDISWKHPLCHLKADTPQRIVVTIYLEGWDKLMTDDLYEAAFDISIGFTGLTRDIGA